MNQNALRKREMSCRFEKRGRVYLLTLTGTGEHRLNPTTLKALRSALARARSDSALRHGGRATALVLAAEGKFFSNGLDLTWARLSPTDRLPILSSSLRAAFADLISLPMPTIAAVTGHSAAAGFAFALCFDYVFMRADRGFLYMSEMDAGLPLARYFAELVRAKIADPRAIREVVMMSAKVTAARAVEMGIVERAVVGEAETVEAAVEMGEELARKDWDGRVYASIRKSVFAAVSRELGVEEGEEEKGKLFASKI